MPQRTKHPEAEHLKIPTAQREPNFTYCQHLSKNTKHEELLCFYRRENRNTNWTHYKRDARKSRLPNGRTLFSYYSCQIWHAYVLLLTRDDFKDMKPTKFQKIALLTKNNILDFSTTAGVPGGAIGGALGGIVKQNCTFHFSWLAWSGNCLERAAQKKNSKGLMSVTYMAMNSGSVRK